MFCIKKQERRERRMKAAGSPCDFVPRPELLQLKCSLINVSFSLTASRHYSQVLHYMHPFRTLFPPPLLILSSHHHHQSPPLFRPTTASSHAALIPVPIRVELLQLKSHSTAALGSNELKGFPPVSLRKWIICHLRFSLLLKVQSVHACHP